MMNREILFKGKVKGTNDWIRGYLIKELSTRKTYICDLNYFNEDTKLSDVLVEVEPETVCQYIDSVNDIDLYENDIVHGFEDLYDNEVQGKVILNLENGLQLHCKDKVYHFDYIYDFQVIGNIFDEENKCENK